MRIRDVDLLTTKDISKNVAVACKKVLERTFPASIVTVSAPVSIEALDEAISRFLSRYHKTVVKRSEEHFQIQLNDRKVIDVIGKKDDKEMQEYAGAEIMPGVLGIMSDTKMEMGFKNKSKQETEK